MYNIGEKHRQSLKDLFSENETWLMERILQYAKIRDYTKYTSPLLESWKISIQMTTDTIRKALDSHQNIPELNPDEDFSADPIVSFGILEAQKHRNRGITLSMFLGLFKYYRQTYLDLIIQTEFDSQLNQWSLQFINRIFDRIEIGFTGEWSTFTEEDRLKELEESNRKITNEKNRFLTIIESFINPVLLLDIEKNISYINNSAGVYFDIPHTSGSFYYQNNMDIRIPGWLKEKIHEFYKKQDPKLIFDHSIIINDETRYCTIQITEMQDVSRKFSGALVELHDITDKYLSSEALLQSVEKFSGMFKAASHGMVVASPEGNFEMVNEAFCNIVGYSENELLNMDFKELTYPDDLDHDLMLFQMLSKGEIPSYQIEKRYIHKKGGIVWILLSASVVKDKEGKPVNFIGQIINITDRKRSQEILREYQEAIEGSRDMIAVVDSNYIYKLANTAFLESRGLSRENVIGHTAADVLGVEVFEKTVKPYLDKSLEGETVSFEMVNSYPEKGERYMQVDYYPLTIEEENVNRVIAIISDITDNKKAEILLAESEAQYRSLFEESPIPLWEIDISNIKLFFDSIEDGDIESYLKRNPHLWKDVFENISVINVNHAALILLEFSDKKLFIENFNQMLAPSSYPILRKQVLTFYKGHTQYNTEMEFKTMKGNQIWAMARTIIPSGYEETWEKEFVSIIDITERKKLEEETKLLATKDSLTGANNRRRIYKAAQEEFNRSRRYNNSLAFIMIDIDHFKAINDTYGHPVGDQILKILVGECMTSLRETDSFGRIGGEEFLALLPETDKEGAAIVAERLRSRIANLKVEADDSIIQFTISLGITEILISDESPEDIIKRGDEALYAAKRKGRNCFIIK